MGKPSKPFRITVAFGRTDKRYKTFHFESVAELKAFEKGLEEAEGYTEVNVLHTNEGDPT